jgi:hypothetical protein
MRESPGQYLTGPDQSGSGGLLIDDSWLAWIKVEIMGLVEARKGRSVREWPRKEAWVLCGRLSHSMSVNTVIQCLEVESDTEKRGLDKRVTNDPAICTRNEVETNMIKECLV